MADTALTRFIRYAKVDTQSSEVSDTYPSTLKQLNLLRMLAGELTTMGLSGVSMDDHGYVMATLPSNLPAGHPAAGKVPKVGLIAHVDTSPSAPGENVTPQIIEKYDGKDIVLPGNPSVVIRVDENPELKANIGKMIVTSDGTTLLGADDKAGIAIIMTALDHLISRPALLHGDIRVCFTPDEEVGAGTRYFDLAKFGADFAYTVDGDTPGELNKETFSADLATITVHGRNIHPGSAKNIMVNSIRAMADIVARMPKDMAPETTEGYEPYIHPHTLEGEEAKSTLKILLRDFNTAGLAVLRKKLEAIIAEVRPLHPKAKIELDVLEQYRNMADFMGSDTRLLDVMFEATRRAGLEPVWKPIRGGTDGSRLTEKGLPTPNIFTGGQNYHGPTEWLSVEGMLKSVDTLVHLAQIWVEKSSA
jgi:tripeptide aminopeptidase